MRASTRSPTRTFVDGLAGDPFTTTWPASHNRVASGRVFTRRTAHSQRSMRVVSAAGGAVTSEPPGDGCARVRRVGTERAGVDGGIEVRAQPVAVLADPGQRRSDRPRDADPGALGRRRSDAVATPESQGRGQLVGQGVGFVLEARGALGI